MNRDSLICESLVDSISNQKRIKVNRESSWSDPSEVPSRNNSMKKPPLISNIESLIISNHFQTIDECILDPRKFVECSPSRMAYMLPFFCGNDKICSEASDETFQRALRNMKEKFLVVGLTEQIDDFFPVLEKLFPAYFENISKKWNKQGDVCTNLAF